MGGLGRAEIACLRRALLSCPERSNAAPESLGRPLSNMRRRDFVTLLGGAAAAWPIAASGQDRTVPLIGFLNSASPGPFARLMDGFRRGLREGGCVEGRNVRMEYRWGEGRFARLSGVEDGLVDTWVCVLLGRRAW